MRFNDLWSTHGTIDRGAYVTVGLIGFALKHNIDRFVAKFAFDKPWEFFNYWISPFALFSDTPLSQQDTNFLLTMFALSLPFIWVGVVLTLKRLRSVGLPGWCVCFFSPTVLEPPLLPNSGGPAGAYRTRRGHPSRPGTHLA